LAAVSEVAAIRVPLPVQPVLALAVEPVLAVVLVVADSGEDLAPVAAAVVEGLMVRGAVEGSVVGLEEEEEEEGLEDEAVAVDHEVVTLVAEEEDLALLLMHQPGPADLVVLALVAAVVVWAVGIATDRAVALTTVPAAVEAAALATETVINVAAAATTPTLSHRDPATVEVAATVVVALAVPLMVTGSDLVKIAVVAVMTVAGSTIDVARTGSDRMMAVVTTRSARFGGIEG